MQRVTTVAIQKVHFLPEIQCTLNIYNRQNKFKKNKSLKISFFSKPYFISPPHKIALKTS